MGDRQTAQAPQSGAHEWYLVASRGAMVIRVRGGMLIGETADGELDLFDRSCAQLELDIASDGSLLLNATNDYQLELANGACRPSTQLTPQTRAHISLPNNLVQLSNDFADLRQTKDSLQIRPTKQSGEAKPQPGRLVERLMDRRPSEAPAPANLPSSKPAGTASPPPAEPVEPPQAAAKPAASPTPEQEQEPIKQPESPRAPIPHFTPMQTGRDEHENERQQWTTRKTQILTAALIWLAGIALTLMYLTSGEDPQESPAAVSSTLASKPVDADSESDSAEAPDPGVDTTAAAPIPAMPTPSPAVEAPPPRVDAPDPAEGKVDLAPAMPAPAQAQEPEPSPEPAAEADTKEAAADNPTLEPEPAAAPVIEPIALPPLQRRSITRGATRAPTIEAQTAREPSNITADPADPALLAELEGTANTLRAQIAEVAGRRDLLAADLALKQGRLTTPAEPNAYDLYSAVLAQNPDSTAARKGITAIQGALINRAFAQLAGNELDAARGTLDAASDAGANPGLIADLSGEVDYRQRLRDARAGRFDSLYPPDQLVAVTREPLRLTNGGATGSEVSLQAQFTVTVSGEVTDVTVLGNPPPELEQEMRRTISGWRFEPVLYQGRPIPVRSQVDVGPGDRPQQQKGN